MAHLEAERDRNNVNVLRLRRNIGSYVGGRDEVPERIYVGSVRFNNMQVLCASIDGLITSDRILEMLDVSVSIRCQREMCKEVLLYYK